MPAAKHFLFTVGDFSSAVEANHIRQWVDLYRKRLTDKGLDTELFSPWSSKVRPGDSIHVFGLTQTANWARLKQIPAKVYVFSLPGGSDSGFVAPSKWKIWFELIRKSLHPEIECVSEAFHSVDAYFLNATDSSQIKSVYRNCTIFSLAEPPETAADQFYQLISR